MEPHVWCFGQASLIRGKQGLVITILNESSVFPAKYCTFGGV